MRSDRAYIKGNVIAGRRTRCGILAFLLLPDHRDRAFVWRVELRPKIRELLLAARVEFRRSRAYSPYRRLVTA
jgi:hypothetical protein